MQPGTMFDFKLEMTHMTFDKSRKKRREKGDCMGEQGRKKPPGILLVFPQRSSEILIKLFSNYVEKAVLFWPRQRTEEAGMQ